MNRRYRISIFFIATVLFGIAILFVVISSRKTLTEKDYVSEFYISPNALLQSGVLWVSDFEVLTTSRENLPDEEMHILRPLLTDTRTGEQRKPEGLAQILEKHPTYGMTSTHFLREEWCLFFLRTDGERQEYVRLLVNLDGTECHEISIDHPIFRVFSIPQTFTWLELQHNWGANTTEWYLTKGKNGERKLVKQENRIVEPVGFTATGTFIFAITQFPSSPPITLEYWELEPVPRLLKTETIADLPGHAILVKASPTGENILWEWGKPEIDFRDYRILPSKIGYSISSIDGENFKKLGTFPYDSSPLGTFWTPSGNAFSFEHERKYYLLELEFDSDSKSK